MIITIIKKIIIITIIVVIEMIIVITVIIVMMMIIIITIIRMYVWVEITLCLHDTRRSKYCIKYLSSMTNDGNILPIVV